MAVYKLFPLQDATVYSFYPTMNTGIDSIIEIGNLNVNINPVPQVFRFLCKFDQNQINDVIDNKIGGTQFSSSLKTYIANAQGIIFDTELEIYPISGSWSNGSGTYLDSPFTTNGVSWLDRSFSGSNPWETTFGQELVIDGNFSNGGTHWIADGEISISNQTASFNVTTDSITKLSQNSVMEIGKPYELSYNITNYTAGGLSVVRFGINGDDGLILPTSVGNHTVTGSAFQPRLQIKRQGNPTTLGITDISVKYADSYVTASYSGSDNAGGCTWYTGSSDPNNTNIAITQSFTLRSDKDLNAPVTDIIKVWYSSSKSIGGYTNIENNGFIVKWEDAIEFNPADAIQPIMQFYSVDTNTIYPPALEIKWNDHSFITGSLPPIQTSDLFVALDNNPGIFYEESINRFRLNVRPDYPARIFSTQSIDTINHYLPSSSLYAIKDLDTNEFIVDFDSEFTKISCDAQSNYFDVYMNGLQPERYYKILIQTTISGSTIVKDDNYNFKIVNG